MYLRKRKKKKIEVNEVGTPDDVNHGGANCASSCIQYDTMELQQHRRNHTHNNNTNYNSSSSSSSSKRQRRQNNKISLSFISVVSAAAVFFLVVAWHYVIDTLRTTTTIINTKSKQENRNVIIKSKTSPANNKGHNTTYLKHYYHGLWNFTTHSITIPDKQPTDPTTSLELLQDIIHNKGTNNQDDDAIIHDYINGKESARIPECFIPNISRTKELVLNTLTTGTKSSTTSSPLLGRPIINVGLSKCGSSSLYHFFKCLDDINDNNGGLKYNPTHNREGGCIATAVQNGYPPISGCDQIPRDVNALLEMNIQEPKKNGGSKPKQDHQCWYPQISFLDEIHHEYPTATFILIFRRIHDWIRSVYSWSDLVQRLTSCRYNIPGLMIKERSGGTSSSRMSSSRLSYQDSGYFYCIHVQHIRRFVQQYPSHKLIELDLYDNNQTSYLLSTLFDDIDTTSSVTSIGKKKTKPSSRMNKKKEKSSSTKSPSTSSLCWGKYNENTNLAQRLEEHQHQQELMNQNRTP